MNLELVEEKISNLQDNSVEVVTIDYDTYSLEVEALCNGTFVNGYVVKYKGVTISEEYPIELLLKELERYELYPKSYFENVLSKREEHYKRSKFVNKINDDIEKMRQEFFNLNMEIGHYKEVNGVEKDNYHKIKFDILENEVNRIKDNHSDLLNNMSDENRYLLFKEND